jgi:hypothetical protein
MNSDNNFQPPEEFIDTLIACIIETGAQDEAVITIPYANLLHLFEFRKDIKVRGISSPYVSIEWSSVQIPHALTPILKDGRLNIYHLNNDGVHDTTAAYFFERNQAGRGLDVDKFPEHTVDFLSSYILTPLVTLQNAHYRH